MTRKQLILMAVQAALLLVAGLWQYRRLRYRQRVREQMADRGETPARPPRRSSAQLVTMALVLVVVALMFWLEPKLTTALGGTWGKVAAWGGLFVAIWVGLLFATLARRDNTVGQAERMMAGGDADGALGLLRAAVESMPTARRFAMIGVILSQKDRYLEAVDAFARAAQLDPEKLGYVVARALSMGRAGRAAEALDEIAALRNRYPQDGGLALTSAALLVDLGRLDEAREQFRQGEELLRAFTSEQRVDAGTSVTLTQMLHRRLGPAGARAFEVGNA